VITEHRALIYAALVAANLGVPVHERITGDMVGECIAIGDPEVNVTDVTRLGQIRWPIVVIGQRVADEAKAKFFDDLVWKVMQVLFAGCGCGFVLESANPSEIATTPSTPAYNITGVTTAGFC
jgi:hypothetical protein